MKHDKKYIIWTSDPWEYDTDERREEIIQFLKEMAEIEEPTEADIDEEYMYNLNLQFEAERHNLNIALPEEIIAIANLGLWSGRHVGCKETHNTNIADCLECLEDYDTFYVDDLGDFRHESIHHDGRNYILYRQWREGLSDTQKENFIEKVLYGKVTRRDINRYTIRLGDKIAKVYGWKVRKAS